MDDGYKPQPRSRKSAASHQSCFTKDVGSIHDLIKETEEVEVAAAITEMLTQPGSTWTDRGGNQRPLTLDDIFIVAFRAPSEMLSVFPVLWKQWPLPLKAEQRCQSDERLGS
jgi:hypothetical protein